MPPLRRPIPLAAVYVSALLVASPAAAEETPPAAEVPPAVVVAGADGKKARNPRKGKKKRSGPRFGFGLHVGVEYTSNLFHEQERRLALLRSPNGLGERYYRMVGPQDLVTTPGGELTVRWKRKKRETKLSLGAEYAIHARNPIANHLVLEAKAARDLTRRDSLSLGLELTPSRFKKNYAYREAAGTKLFDRADYLEWEAALDYDRRWAKRWRTNLELGFGQVRYAEPFSNHDENAYAGGLSVEYDPWKRLTLALGVDAGITLTPDGDEFGERVDRSRDDVEPSFGVVLDLPLHFEVEASVAYRVRIYTTAEAQDGVHFDRVDRRLTLGGGVTKHFGPFAVALEASLADSQAHRADPAEDPDAYGYEEFAAGLTLGYAVD